ncbi:MAG: hypothetical protein JW884_14800, partial [Deltaproteobacteria bacterium]|nr:hypothetical protein [Deltaproteobacteria bacterium]
MRTLGLCLGASTISIAELECESTLSGFRCYDSLKQSRIVGHHLQPHEGNPRQALVAALATIDLATFERIAVTGRRFRGLVNLSVLSEPEAVEKAYRHARPEGVQCPAVVSAGGESF